MNGCAIFFPDLLQPLVSSVIVESGRQGLCRPCQDQETLLSTLNRQFFHGLILLKDINAIGLVRPHRISLQDLSQFAASRGFDIHRISTDEHDRIYDRSTPQMLSDPMIEAATMAFRRVPWTVRSRLGIGHQKQHEDCLRAVWRCRSIKDVVWASLIFAEIAR